MGEYTSATLKAAGVAACAGETAAGADADADAARDADEDMGVVVYSADAAWREVYNDAEADTSDADTATDGDEVIDVGVERDWSTAATTSVVPAPAHSSASISSKPVEEVPAEPATAAAGGFRYAQKEDKVGGGGDGRANGESEEQEDADSLQGEASGVDALVANAMALADAAETDAEGLAFEGGGAGDQFHTATTSASDKDYASPRGSVREVVSSGVFGSAKSAANSNWNDGEDTDGGEAEREAEEVQALVAEALALVKEANQDS